MERKILSEIKFVHTQYGNCVITTEWGTCLSIFTEVGDFFFKSSEATWIRM